ncbi:demethylrebeccamycin-D-glucose O-methyltransferase [bacterium BMS3Abin05]|nr:demethylrebeccamycin-D-glucose O-methyltransferase [bacterium BMS3Abin05]GBE28003.1 demethylrebeccamycin-D-glucose O-methyltransferase [bacterium BMS3Bbin03]
MKRKNHYYDGRFYRRFIDPNLQEVREIIADYLPNRASLIDIGCGTGALLFHLAPKCSRLIGIELSPRMIDSANTEKRNRRLNHVEFRLADASRLSMFKDREFDAAVTSMVLHEMPQSARRPVIREMKRIARQLIIADYAIPQPGTKDGLITYPIEFAAGPSHFKGFLSFRRTGGLPGLLNSMGLEIESSTLNRSRTIQVVKLKS